MSVQLAKSGDGASFRRSHHRQIYGRTLRLPFVESRSSVVYVGEPFCPLMLDDTNRCPKKTGIANTAIRRDERMDIIAVLVTLVVEVSSVGQDGKLR